MKQNVFSIAALAIVLGACTSGLDEPLVGNQEIEGNDIITVTIDPESRTVFDTDGKNVVWSTGDAIGIFCGDENDITEYTLSGTPNGNSANFTGVSSGTKNAAVYPFNEEAKFDGNNTITTTLAKEITYSESSINNAPMAAKIDENAQNTISFKNPGAILEVTVNNIPAGYKGAKLSAGEQKIAGKAQIVFAEDTPTLSLLEDESNSSDITISFEETTAPTNMVFYFPLPLENYTTLKFSMIKSDNKEQQIFSKGLNAQRNKKYYKDFTFDTVISDIDALTKACSNGGEYSLIDDVQGDFVVSAIEPLTLNLNGHTVSNKSGDTFTVNSGASLTIEGEGTVDNLTHQKACIYNNGTVVLKGGNFTRSKEAGTNSPNAANGNSYYVILNHGTMTIADGVTVEANGGFSSLIANGYYDYSNTENERVGYINTTGQETPSLTINGGTFNGGLNTIKNDDNATLTIAGGVFSNTSQATVQNNHIATINGGTFTPNPTSLHAVESKSYNNSYNEGKTTITGGTFKGDMYLSGAKAKYEISGGSYTDVNVVSYVTGGTVDIELDKDVEIKKPAYLQSEATVNVDLNGHNVTNKTPLDLSKTYLFTEVFKAKAGTLNISDSKGGAKVQALNDDDNEDGYRYAVCAIDNATVNISGGSFYNHQNNNQQLDLVEVNNNAKVYITGGTFESGCYGTPNNAENGRFWVLNKNNSAKSTCTIEVSGGVFVNFNPANPNMDDDNSYLKEGFKVESYTDAACIADKTDAIAAHKGTTPDLKRWYKVVANN